MHEFPLRLAVRVSVGALALALAAQVSAERLGDSRTGTVETVSGSAAAQLAALGVVEGAPATLTFGVESTALGEPAVPAGTSYPGAITDFRLAIGDYEFIGDPDSGVDSIVLSQNDVSLAPGAPTSDSYGLSLFGGDGGILENPPLLVFGSSTFADISARAMSDEGVFQEIGGFGAGFASAGLATVVGSNGAIAVVFGLAPANPCLAEQIGAGGELCRVTLRCYADQAKDPGQPPEELTACLDDANARFVQAFDASALQSSECLSQDDGATTVAGFAPAAVAVNGLVTANANPADKNDSKLRSKALKATSKAVGAALKVESKNAKKPKPEKRDKKREKVRTKLVKKLDKIQKQATRKGVALTFETEELVDATEALIDEVFDVSSGAPL